MQSDYYYYCIMIVDCLSNALGLSVQYSGIIQVCTGQKLGRMYTSRSCILGVVAGYTHRVEDIPTYIHGNAGRDIDVYICIYLHLFFIAIQHMDNISVCTCARGEYTHTCIPPAQATKPQGEQMCTQDMYIDIVIEVIDDKFYM